MQRGRVGKGAWLGPSAWAKSRVRRAHLQHTGQAILPTLRHRYQPAHAGERSKMMVGVAEQGVDHGDTLEVVAGLVFHGHADAAVELDRALADDAARATDLDLGGGDGFSPLE